MNLCNLNSSLKKEKVENTNQRLLHLEKPITEELVVVKEIRRRQDEFEYVFPSTDKKLLTHLSPIRCIHMDSYLLLIFSRMNQLDLENNLVKNPRLRDVLVFLPESDREGDKKNGANEYRHNNMKFIQQILPENKQMSLLF